MTEPHLFLANMTPEEKYERVKAQNRARQRTYYAKNRDVFQVKKKEAVVLIQSRRGATPYGIEPEVINASHNEPAEPIHKPIHKPEVRAEVPEPIRIHSNKRKLKGKTYQKILDEWSGDGEHTLKTNITQLNGIYELLDTPREQVLDLHHADFVIARIMNRKKPNGDYYATASNVKLLQVLLKIISPSNRSVPLIPIPEEQVLIYKHKHDALDANVRENTETKKHNEVIGNWNDLVRQVLTKEGATSKAYVYLTLYDLLKCRDDMQLKIVKTEAEANDKETNYIVIPEKTGQTGLLILNRFKTDKGFSRKRISIKQEVVHLVKNYNHYQGYGGFLFGTGKQANFVSSLLEKYGMKLQGGGIDLLRKMLRAKDMLGVKSIDDEVKLAYDYGHSIKTAQATYSRVNKTPEVFSREPNTEPLNIEDITPKNPPVIAPKKYYDIRKVLTRIKR